LQNPNKDQKKIEPCGSCFARLVLMGDKWYENLKQRCYRILNSLG
jgi:hypothetical protein